MRKAVLPGGPSGRNRAGLHGSHAGLPSISTRLIRIAIADAHTLFRAALRRLLAGEPDFEVVAEAAQGSDVFSVLETHKPDVLLLDLPLPIVSGLNVLQHLQTSGGYTTRVLVLTASESEQDLAQAMKLGASGVVLKTSPTELLMNAIRQVAGGEVWLDGQVTARVIRNLADPRSSRSRSLDVACGLTPREREIAALVGQGYRYREIAEMLSISEQTVKNHLRNMFHKLGVSDRLQLALFAIHHNL
jgi:DNA-binding NarL/FixJ family response regulator